MTSEMQVKNPLAATVSAARPHHLGVQIHPPNCFSAADDRRGPALRLAAILDSDRPHNRLRHRTATVELRELVGALARERILRTADTGRAAT